MESRVRSLEAQRLHAAGLALGAGTAWNDPSHTEERHEQRKLHLEIIEPMGLFVSGAIGRRELHGKLLETSRHGSALLRAPARTALGLAILLSEASVAIEHERLRSCLRGMLAALGCRRPLPVGEVLGCLGESPGRVELTTPATHRESPFDSDAKWIDLAIDQPTVGFRLIPASIFTRSFFRRTLRSNESPENQANLARYHRENDKAPGLIEACPWLSEHTPFEYYVDESGLSELVLDTERLGWGERFHAARVFALYSNLDHAVLEGVPLLDQ